MIAIVFNLPHTITVYMDVKSMLSSDNIRPYHEYLVNSFFISNSVNPFNVLSCYILFLGGGEIGSDQYNLYNSVKNSSLYLGYTL